MAARRCSTCATNWPPLVAFSKCPACGEKTDQLSDATPIRQSDAERTVRRLTFEREYRKWEQGQESECGEWGGGHKFEEVVRAREALENAQAAGQLLSEIRRLPEVP